MKGHRHSSRIILAQVSLLAQLLAICEGRSTTTGTCTIDLRQDGNLPDIAPILTTYHQDWLLPTADAKITLEQGSVMRISCPGFGFSNEDLRNSQFHETKCVGGTEFSIDGTNYQYKDLGCDDWPLETIVENGSCGNDGSATLIDIGFPVSPDTTKALITSCLEKTRYQSLWSRHVVPKVIDQRNPGGDMPYFSDDGLYDFQLEVYEYYTKNMQRDTIAVLVGSEDLASQYVHETGNIYMSRGHLAPKADFMYTSWQRASYHYINVEAQFQIFNEKNWFYLEDGLREAVVKNGKDYTVYTGSHGVMELDDINNNKVEIHLNLERADLARLPAPRYYWKMIIDESLNLGVVVIGVNNPFLSESEAEDYKKLCPSIPDHPLFDNIYYPDDIQKGIMYACSVADAQKSIHEIPKEVTVSGVLY